MRPLDYGKQAIALNIRGEMNSNDDLGADSDDTGYRASFSYIDQFMDGKLGFAFGYAHLDSPLATRGFGTYEPWNAAGQRRRRRELRRRLAGRLRQQSWHRGRQLRDERHEGPRGHGFHGT